MSLSGAVQIFANDIDVTGSTQVHDVGTLGMTTDGRFFRYAKAGATALDPGKLCVAATQVTDDENIAVAAAAAVGATQVTVTLGSSAVTANQYANGYLVVNDAAGEGTAYLISGHPAASAAASLVVTLKESVRVALTTSSQVTLAKNLWQDIVISATDQADKAVGVPNVAIAASEYGWVQTKGMCAVLADEAVTAGLALTIGTGVAGAVEAADLVGEQIVGTAYTALVDTEYRSAVLSIDQLDRFEAYLKRLPLWGFGC